MLTGLPPLVNSRTRLLILGSFPGAASLAAQQYYGHPQNQFWRILQAIYPSSPIVTGVNSYKIRSEWLLGENVGLWDVYAACEREGSLDSRIRQPVVNDFAGLQRLCPALEAVAHNGAESFKQARHLQLHGLPAYLLPSSSPAHAAWSFERKLAAWREVFEKHGMI